MIFKGQRMRIWQIQGAGTQYSDAAIAWAVGRHDGLFGGRPGQVAGAWVSENCHRLGHGRTNPTYTYRLHYTANGGMALGKDGITGGSG